MNRELLVDLITDYGVAKFNDGAAQHHDWAAEKQRTREAADAAWDRVLQAVYETSHIREAKPKESAT